MWLEAGAIRPEGIHYILKRNRIIDDAEMLSIIGRALVLKGDVLRVRSG